MLDGPKTHYPLTNDLPPFKVTRSFVSRKRIITPVSPYFPFRARIFGSQQFLWFRPWNHFHSYLPKTLHYASASDVSIAHN